MFAALIIVFREVLEAGLVLGVVLAATRGIARRGLWIAAGVGAGVLGACLVAVFAGEIASLFAGAGEEVFNAGILLVAVVMLAWHNAWMASHGRALARELKAVGQDVVAGRRPLAVLAIVCGVAVLREGSEVVLFLYGVAVAGGTTAAEIFTGGSLGILAGAAISALLYFGLIAIPLRYLFNVLTILITLLAAGLAAQAVDFLGEAGWIERWSRPLWDSSGILSQDGVIGRVLHILVGYNDRPTGLELAVYAAVIVAMLVLLRIAAAASSARPAPTGR